MTPRDALEPARPIRAVSGMVSFALSLLILLGGRRIPELFGWRFSAWVVVALFFLCLLVSVVLLDSDFQPRHDYPRHYDLSGAGVRVRTVTTVTELAWSEVQQVECIDGGWRLVGRSKKLTIPGTAFSTEDAALLTDLFSSRRVPRKAVRGAVRGEVRVNLALARVVAISANPRAWGCCCLVIMMPVGLALAGVLIEVVVRLLGGGAVGTISFVIGCLIIALGWGRGFETLFAWVWLRWGAPRGREWHYQLGEDSVLMRTTGPSARVSEWDWSHVERARFGNDTWVLRCVGGARMVIARAAFSAEDAVQADALIRRRSPVCVGRRRDPFVRTGHR